MPHARPPSHSSYFVGSRRPRAVAIAAGGGVFAAGVTAVLVACASYAPWWPSALQAALPDPWSLAAAGLLVIVLAPLIAAVLLAVLGSESQTRVDFDRDAVWVIASTGERALRWTQIAGYRELDEGELELVVQPGVVTPDLLLPFEDADRERILDALASRGVPRVR